jgi:hypothetical protein
MVVFDAMDSNKVAIPRFRTAFTHCKHLEAEGKPLGTRVIGCLMPGRGLLNYWTIPRFPQAGDLTATILLDLFTKVSRSRTPSSFVDSKPLHYENILYVQVLHKEARLPPVLILQADNCGRENKNNVMMKFLAALVELGVFEMVELYFLPVGHTHDEIDQRWSLLSRYLNNRDSLNLSQIMEDTQRAFSKSDKWVEQVLVDHIVDFET